MRQYLVPLAVVLLFLSGCVTSSNKLQEVEIGMSKQEVFEVLGSPKSVSARADGSEFLRYQLSGRRAGLYPNDAQFADGYTVQLKNNKVVAYGRDDEFEALDVTIKTK